MEKRFIKKTDLGEIMEELTKAAMRHAGKLELMIRVHSWCDENVMTVMVTDHASQVLKKMDYIIVDELETWDMIVDDTISDAIYVLEKQEVDKKAREEQKEETTNTK